MVNINDLSEHFYIILPNGNGFMVEWATIVSDGIMRVPASGERKYDVFFGVEDTLDECINKIQKLQECHHTDYDVVVYKRTEKVSYVYEPDYML